LHWSSLKTYEANMADMLRAAELGFMRPDEFRKNAVKLGWELWEKPQLETAAEGAKQ
jgi:hypothetical protein